MGFYNRFTIAYGDLIATDRQSSAGRQADDGIAAPLFAALGRFQQVRIWTVSKFQINR